MVRTISVYCLTVRQDRNTARLLGNTSICAAVLLVQEAMTTLVAVVKIVSMFGLR